MPSRIPHRRRLILLDPLRPRRAAEPIAAGDAHPDHEGRLIDRPGIGERFDKGALLLRRPPIGARLPWHGGPFAVLGGGELGGGLRVCVHLRVWIMIRANRTEFFWGALRRPTHGFRQHVGNIGVQRNAFARGDDLQLFVERAGHALSPLASGLRTGDFAA